MPNTPHLLDSILLLVAVGGVELLAEFVRLACLTKIVFWGCIARNADIASKSAIECSIVGCTPNRN